MTKKGAGAPSRRHSNGATFRREFKLQVIREVEAGKTQAQVARDYQLSDNTISKWRRELRKYKERAFAGRGHAYTDEARVNELERMVATHHGERLFKKALAETGNRELSRRQAQQQFMTLMQKELGERPTAERALRSLGEAVGLSRSTIFRHLHSSGANMSHHEVELRGQIQSVALEMRAYGYPTEHQRTAAPRGASQSQARFALAAARQSALFAAASFCAHYRCQSLVAGLPQPGARVGAFKHQSTLGLRHYLPFRSIALPSPEIPPPPLPVIRRVWLRLLPPRCNLTDVISLVDFSTQAGLLFTH